MIIEESWRRLQIRLSEIGFGSVYQANLREAFVGALYAASAAISSERADSRAISEAAHRIEALR